MKKTIGQLLLCLILTMNGVAFGCDDLSGVYKSEPRDGYEPFNLIIVQTNCDSMSVTRDFYKLNMQFQNDVIFDNKIYDEDMFGYTFSRKYYWDNQTASYSGKLYDKNGNYQYDIRGVFGFSENVLLNSLEFFDSKGTLLGANIEHFQKK